MAAKSSYRSTEELGFSEFLTFTPIALISSKIELSILLKHVFKCFTLIEGCKALTYLVIIARLKKINHYAL